MSIEPYTYASGETWGEQTTAPAARQASTQPRGRGSSNLVRRLRRAKSDPTWRSKTEESKQLLLRMDERDEQDMARRAREER